MVRLCYWTENERIYKAIGWFNGQIFKITPHSRVPVLCNMFPFSSVVFLHHYFCMYVYTYTGRVIFSHLDGFRTSVLERIAGSMGNNVASSTRWRQSFLLTHITSSSVYLTSKSASTLPTEEKVREFINTAKFCAAHFSLLLQCI